MLEANHRDLAFSDNLATSQQKCARVADCAAMYSPRNEIVIVPYLFFFNSSYFIAGTRSGSYADVYWAYEVTRFLLENQKEHGFAAGYKTNNEGLITSRFVMRGV
jgi:hypothetical protein